MRTIIVRRIQWRYSRTRVSSIVKNTATQQIKRGRKLKEKASRSRVIGRSERREKSMQDIAYRRLASRRGIEPVALQTQPHFFKQGRENRSDASGLFSRRAIARARRQCTVTTAAAVVCGRRRSLVALSAVKQILEACLALLKALLKTIHVACGRDKAARFISCRCCFQKLVRACPARVGCQQRQFITRDCCSSSLGRDDVTAVYQRTVVTTNNSVCHKISPHAAGCGNDSRLTELLTTMPAQNSTFLKTKLFVWWAWNWNKAYFSVMRFVESEEQEVTWFASLARQQSLRPTPEKAVNQFYLRRTARAKLNVHKFWTGGMKNCAKSLRHAEKKRFWTQRMRRSVSLAMATVKLEVSSLGESVENILSNERSLSTCGVGAKQHELTRISTNSTRNNTN